MGLVLFRCPSAIFAEFSSKAAEIGHSSSEIVRKSFSEDVGFSTLQSPAGIAGCPLVLLVTI